MVIRFTNNFDKEFSELEGGTAFVSGGTPYIKIDGILETRAYEMYNALNLLSGIPAYFKDDEWVQTLQFKGEWYIG